MLGDIAIDIPSCRMTMHASPYPIAAAMAEEENGQPAMQSWAGALEPTKLPIAPFETNRLAKDAQSHTIHGASNGTGNDTASDFQAHQTSREDGSEYSDKTAKASRRKRVKTIHSKPNTTDFQEDAGNATEDEEIACQQKIADAKRFLLRRRAQRHRELNESEQTQLKELDQEFDALSAKLRGRTSRRVSHRQVDANPQHSCVQKLTRTTHTKPAALRGIKRKRPNQPKKSSTSLQKIESGYRSKGVTGQDISLEITSGSAIQERPVSSKQFIPEPDKVSTNGAQLVQRRDWALQAPGADKKQVRAEIHDISSALKYFGGDNKVEVKKDSWLLEGMATPLFDYQLTGAAWMMRRERGRLPPSGGIFSDDMGCGKTITTLALIWKNQPPKKGKVKVTLIVVPNHDLTTQWIKEAKTHCPGLAASRFTRKGVSSAATFNNFQVMVVTYTDIERSWSKTQKARTGEQSRSTKNEPIGNEENLFHFTFHRLVLDECTSIKNHRSATARAVFNLKAKHVWCISATPSPNHLDEYFPYLKVLGYGWASDIKTFHQTLLKNQESLSEADTDAESEDENKIRSKALEKILQDIQLCRKRTTKFLGQSLFSDVPDNLSKLEMRKLSQDERLLYGVIVEPLRKELESKQKLLATEELPGKSGLADETPKQERSFFVAQILQLYKLTAHPYMLESILLSKQFSLEQIQGLLANFKNLSVNSGSFLLNQVTQVTQDCVKVEDGENNWTANTGAQSAASGLSGSEAVTTQEDPFNMAPQLQLVLGMRAQERHCKLCSADIIPSEAILTNCMHVYCKDHWKKVCALATYENKSGEVECLNCGKTVEKTREIDQSDVAKAYSDLLAAEQSKKSVPKASKKSKARTKERIRGDDFNGFQPKGERSLFLQHSDKNHPQVPLPQSAKTRAVKEIVLQWQDEAPDDKIILFTQWVLMGKILGRLLEDLGIPFLYYFGDMKAAEKERNLQDFENIKDIKVMIMGFKCGGFGLDMKYANRVILVEPFWNESAEDQALARILRKIQRKKTYCVRLLVEDSIDMHISAIKEAKTDIISRLRKEDDPKKRYEIEVKFASIALNGSARSDGHDGDDSYGFEEDTDNEDEKKVGKQPEEEDVVS